VDAAEATSQTPAAGGILVPQARVGSPGAAGHTANSCDIRTASGQRDGVDMDVRHVVPEVIQPIDAGRGGSGGAEVGDGHEHAGVENTCNQDEVHGQNSADSALVEEVGTIAATDDDPGNAVRY
jgi:hypothetical protein